MNTIGIGLLGAGTVGGTLIKRLTTEHAAIAAKTGLDLQVRRVAVRDPGKSRGLDIPEGMFTTDAQSVIDDPEVEVFQQGSMI